MKTDETIKIEAQICCEFNTCVGDGNSCSHFEQEENGSICQLSEFARYYDLENEENPFPDLDDIENSDELQLGLKMRLVASYIEDDDYINVSHEIFGRDNEWHKFSRRLKESVGINFFSTLRRPESNFKIQHRSLLTNLFSNLKNIESNILKKFRDTLEPLVEKIYDQELKLFFSDDQILQEFPLNSIIDLGFGKIKSADILRQIELSFKFQTENNEGFKIPFSSQGKGLQNLLFLYLCARSNTLASRAPLIFLIEEPEQNLEPQRQRNVIKIVQKIANTNTQIIISTHSPFILVLNKKLEGVIRLKRNENDEIDSINLSEIFTENKKYFEEIRKQCESDLELYESLFSDMILLWEGDCESSFYTTLMRNIENYPSEWLIGITGRGSNLHFIGQWLKKAKYEPVAIIDGDEIQNIENLLNNAIPFIALPNGESIEDLVQESLTSLEEDEMCEILIKTLGIDGLISYPSSPDVWPFLIEIFKGLFPESEDLYNEKIETEVFREEFFRIKSINEGDITQEVLPNNIKEFLKNNKSKRKYEFLAKVLFEKNALSKRIIRILDFVKKIFSKNTEYNSYQMDNDGNINLLNNNKIER